MEVGKWPGEGEEVVEVGVEGVSLRYDALRLVEMTFFFVH